MQHDNAQREDPRATLAHHKSTTIRAFDNFLRLCKRDRFQILTRATDIVLRGHETSKFGSPAEIAFTAFIRLVTFISRGLNSYQSMSHAGKSDPRVMLPTLLRLQGESLSAFIGDADINPEVVREFYLTCIF